MSTRTGEKHRQRQRARQADRRRPHADKYADRAKQAEPNMSGERADECRD